MKSLLHSLSKPALTRLALTFSLLLMFAVGVSAKPPTLEPAEEFTHTVLPNHPYDFKLTYKQSEGDPPATLKMIIDAPNGQITKTISPPGGDPTAGVPLIWNFTPEQSGQYECHFEVTSTTGGFVRYPSGSALIEFESPNSLIKYIVLAVGLVIALFFLPFIVYMLARSANKQGDPAAAARIALLIGILAFCGLAWYLFLYDNQDFPSKMLGIVIEALAVGAFLVVMITRRKTA